MTNMTNPFVSSQHMKRKIITDKDIDKRQNRLRLVIAGSVVRTLRKMDRMLRYVKQVMHEYHISF